MTAAEILEKLSGMADQKSAKGMERVGIAGERAFGVKVPVLRAMAKEVGKDHQLAAELWATGNREGMIIAGLVDSPQWVTEEQMERWVLDFYDWETCDQTIMNLFQKTPFASTKAIEWAQRDEELVKRAGYVLMARIAVADKKATNDDFEPFYEWIVRGATDERNLVKKGVNWALRQIGKRNTVLNEKCLQLCRTIAALDSSAAKWIAADAARELGSEAVQKRLQTVR